MVELSSSIWKIGVPYFSETLDLQRTRDFLLNHGYAIDDELNSRLPPSPAAPVQATEPSVPAGEGKEAANREGPLLELVDGV